MAKRIWMFLFVVVIFCAFGLGCSANSSAIEKTTAQSDINEDTMVSIYVAAGNKAVTQSINGTKIQLDFYGFMEDGKPQWILSDTYFPAKSDINYPSSECLKNYYIYDFYAAEEISKKFTQYYDYDSIDPQVDEIKHNTLRNYGISKNDKVTASFIGVNDSGCVEIEQIYDTTSSGIIRTYDNNNRMMQKDTYHTGDLIASLRYQYGDNGILEAAKAHFFLVDKTVETEYSKDSDGKTDLVTSYQYEGSQRPNYCQPESSRAYYDNNGLRARVVSNDATTEYYYQFTQVTIPSSQVGYITNLYKSLSIPYIIATNTTNIANTF